MKNRTNRPRRPWPPPHLLLPDLAVLERLSLPNLDSYDAISRGEQPTAEPDGPPDTGTTARCLIPLRPIANVEPSR